MDTPVSTMQKKFKNFSFSVVFTSKKRVAITLINPPPPHHIKYKGKKHPIKTKVKKEEREPALRSRTVRDKRILATDKH